MNDSLPGDARGIVLGRLDLDPTGGSHGSYGDPEVDPVGEPAQAGLRDGRRLGQRA